MSRVTLLSMFCGFAMPALLGVGTAWAAPPVVLEVVSDARAPAVMVRPAGRDTVYVPECRGVVWEIFDAEKNRYVPTSSGSCGPAAPPLPVTADGRRFDVDGKVTEGQVVRPVLVVGTGCDPERPFDLAGCKVIESVEGPTITVRGS